MTNSALLEQHRHYADIRRRLFNGEPPPAKPRRLVDVQDRIFRPNERLPMVRARVEPKPPRRRDILHVASADFVPEMTVKQIIAECCQKHGVTMSEMLGLQRFKRIVVARHEAAYRLSKETRLSMPQIGRRLGDRDHTTIIHAIRAHEARMAGKEYRRGPSKAAK